MGFLFITGFNLFALTVQKFGVTVGAVMQKMSILLSVSWTILMYNEPMSALKFIGILAAMAAIVLTSLPPEQETNERAAIPKWMYIFPAYVLLSSGLIEIILFEVEQKSATSGDLNFIATLFGTAFVLGVCVLIFGLLTQKFRWHWNNFIAGAILGVINFGSIYYLMKSIGFGWDGSVVFPINNVAIIGLSVLIAYFALSEKLSKLNWLGVLFAGLSILMITIG